MSDEDEYAEFLNMVQAEWGNEYSLLTALLKEGRINAKTIHIAKMLLLRETINPTKMLGLLDEGNTEEIRTRLETAQRRVTITDEMWLRYMHDPDFDK